MKLRFAICVLIATIGSPPCYADIDESKQADILMLALPASAYLLTWHKHDGEGAWELSRSLALAAISTLALNSIIDKDSPNGSSNDAFPSGHTAIAFSSAAFIQNATAGSQHYRPMSLPHTSPGCAWRRMITTVPMSSAVLRSAFSHHTC